jgi:glycerol-3-phosphate acyltransferase PlsY
MYSSWRAVTAALSPILGRAFSPFLRFRGGKGHLTITL